MGIALLTLREILNGFAHLRGHASGRASDCLHGHAPGLPTPPSRPLQSWRSARPARAQTPAAALPACAARRPAALRVVRVCDADAPSSGRLVISGRMADVCAELDRLAAREAALHAQRPAH